MTRLTVDQEVPSSTLGASTKLSNGLAVTGPPPNSPKVAMMAATRLNALAWNRVTLIEPNQPDEITTRSTCLGSLDDRPGDGRCPRQ